jgi:hypothetical protein
MLRINPLSNFYPIAHSAWNSLPDLILPARHEVYGTAALSLCPSLHFDLLMAVKSGQTSIQRACLGAWKPQA